VKKLRLGRVLVFSGLLLLGATGVSACTSAPGPSGGVTAKAAEPTAGAGTPTSTVAPVDGLEQIDGVRKELAAGWQRVESPDAHLTVGVPAGWSVGSESPGYRGFVAPPLSDELAWKGKMGVDGSPGLGTTLMINEDPNGSWNGSWEGGAEESYRYPIEGAKYVGITVNTDDGSDMGSGPYKKATISILSDAGTQYTLTLLPPEGDDGTRLRQTVGSIELH
jgi:hypothetical protein